MYLGRIVELAYTERLFENPKHPYTKALLSSVPLPDPSKRKELATLQGDVPTPVAIPGGCRFRTRCAYSTEKCVKDFPPMVEVERNHWTECHYDIDFVAKTKQDITTIWRPRALWWPALRSERAVESLWFARVRRRVLNSLSLQVWFSRFASLVYSLDVLRAPLISTEACLCIESIAWYMSFPRWETILGEFLVLFGSVLVCFRYCSLYAMYQSLETYRVI